MTFLFKKKSEEKKDDAIDMQPPSKEDILEKAKEFGSKGFDLAGRIADKVARPDVADIATVARFSVCASCGTQYDVGDDAIRSNNRLYCPKDGGLLIAAK